MAGGILGVKRSSEKHLNPRTLLCATLLRKEQD
ncbi:MAG TPA: hypothetical protein DCW86_01810 [Actinobacteria bacterium]|nr:hypothetical protein [Actinomycetota bacterium]